MPQTSISRPLRTLCADTWSEWQILPCRFRAFAANSPCISGISRLNLKGVCALRHRGLKATATRFYGPREHGAEGKSRSLPAQAAHEDVRKKKRPTPVRDDNFFVGPKWHGWNRALTRSQ